ncbi:hypothetical protein VTJ83DRAFT_5621 [Remersonia thermophila]|uniref:Cyclin N-terminal domain-containing protein n=1 Tax=Remersonia thermophila TaxID=72144 RepID=A0ABR4D8A7_9PEZI
MDSKPQRPARAIPAAHGDENNIIVSRQATHNRQKSTGAALKAMPAASAALNAPPKRTAFADVSNTTRGRAGTTSGKPVKKEVGDIRPKPSATAVTREGQTEIKKTGANQGRPRASTQTKSVAPAAKPRPGATAQGPGVSQRAALGQQNAAASLAQPALRNVVPKKGTFVHHDRETSRLSGYPEAPSPADDIAILVKKPAPAKNPRHTKSQPVLRVEQKHVQKPQTKPEVYPDIVEVVSEGDINDNATEAAYEDAVEHQMSSDARDAMGEAMMPLEKSNLRSSKHELEDALRHIGSSQPEPPAQFEEELWDEEEEQDLYEEQEYTTAHSIRSHGDNTTSSQTALFAPAVTADVRMELEMAKAYVEQHQSIEEVEEEAWDVSMVAEYGDEIFSYMRELEMRMCPNAYYMDDQTEIQWSMRSVLMDWLVQVHHRFCLLPETLFLTVNCIDRFLSVKVVSLGKLQLVGATALFVAAKYEEINCPSVQEIVYMVDSGYSADEILKAERFMLSMLHFEMGWPGPMSFLRRISKADDYDLDTRTMAKYFLEITIMDERFVSCPPSYLAAGAHCISRLFLGKGGWTPGHVHYSGYTLSQLKPLVQLLFDCCWDPMKHHRAVFEKYTTAKHRNVSGLVEARIAHGCTLESLYAEAAERETPLMPNNHGMAVQAAPSQKSFVSIQA